jgi:hypothetical protein
MPARGFQKSDREASANPEWPRTFPDCIFMISWCIRSSRIQYQAGIRVRNLLLDGFNLIKRLRHLPARRFGSWIVGLGDYLTQPIRWLSGAERSDTFVLHDIRPGFQELIKLGQNSGNMLTRTWNPKPRRRRSEQAA